MSNSNRHILIQQLALLRQLQSENLVQIEVLIKYQDNIVRELLKCIEGEKSIMTTGQMGNSLATPLVFVSYSHDSQQHADRVLAFSDRLMSDGIDCVLDQYLPAAPPEGWPRWMDKHIRDAEFVLMVCTETYYKRVMGGEKPGIGLGVRWEGNLVYQHFYNAETLNTRFIPVLLGGGQVSHIPTPFQGSAYYRVDTQDGYERLYRHLTNQPLTPKPNLGAIRPMPPRQRP